MPRCQHGPAEPLSELLENSSEGPEEEEEEEEEKGEGWEEEEGEEASVFAVRRYEQPTCLPLGMDNTDTHITHTKSNIVRKSVGMH